MLWLHKNSLFDIFYNMDSSYNAGFLGKASEIEFKSSTPDVGVAPRDVDWLIPHRVENAILWSDFDPVYR